MIDIRKKEMRISTNENITTFLMYDLDVKPINDKLKKCNAILLCSNPCIEFWFLLNCKEQKNSINSTLCIDNLKKIKKAGVWSNYEKAKLTDSQKEYLKKTNQMQYKEQNY